VVSIDWRRIILHLGIDSAMSEQQQLDRDADNAEDSYQARLTFRIRHERIWRIFEAIVLLLLAAALAVIAIVILGWGHAG